MKQITIGFSKATAKTAIYSKLIMWALKTPYSHVYINYNNNFINRVVYFQASHQAVNIMGNEIFLSQETVIKEFQFNISDTSFKNIHAFIIDNVGKSYGILSLIGLTWIQIGLLLNKKWHNPFADAGQTWICDQLIAAVLNSCENITLPMNINDMTPKDVYDLVSTLPTDLS